MQNNRYDIKRENETIFVVKELYSKYKKLKINRCYGSKETDHEDNLKTNFDGIKLQINDEIFILSDNDVDNVITFLKLIKSK